ncbi:SRPBCC domain-containing protein [Shewanella surugensis]|uniref:SRPBCC domain-containing protein n=1 Tax=Shewanella surugensis TaxID=212020 RepID=A0ABT0LET8_9GAMM|nr:SRPBCC domain-containing protein [Shewanella surugensis]MCL1126221.1 SRPBCC domain-containing protein [Shewanella surugensis]
MLRNTHFAAINLAQMSKNKRQTVRRSILLLIILIWPSLAQAGNVPLIKTDTIIIQAKANDLYNTLLSFDRYALWNPWLFEASGDPSLGGNVWAKLWLDGKEMESNHTIITLETNKAFCWRDEMWYSFLAGGERCRYLIQQDDGSTQVSGSFQFKGVISGLSYLLYKAQMQQGMSDELLGLKTYIESNQ